jgi:hypothetical protein
MTSVDEAPASAPPALFDHCVRAYERMLSEASAHVDGSTGSDTHIAVYEGFLTKLITVDLNLSTPYYTSVRKALISMGCVRQLKRGGGSSPSQWELITAPTFELFETLPVKPKDPTQNEVLRDQLDEVLARLSRAEETISQLVQALGRRNGVEEVQQ